MRKVIPLLLAGALLASGCVVFPEGYDDPFASRISYGYSNRSPIYYWPAPYASTYTYGCGGFYGLDGSCVYYSRRYIPVPADVPLIPETRPRVMATDTPWRYTGVDATYRTTRPEPGVSSRRSATVRPAPSRRSVSSSPPRSTPRSTTRSAPRQTPTRSQPRKRDPVRVDDER